MSSNTFFNQKNKRWFSKNRKPLLIGFSVVAFLLFLGYQVPITGFKQDTEVTKTEEIISNGKKVTTSERVIPAKKFWDWLDIIGVPISLAILGIGYQIIQDQKEAERERDKQIEQEVNTYSENIAKLLTEYNLTDLIKERKKDELKDKKESLDRGLQAIRNKTILVLDHLGIDAEHEILLDEINHLLDKGENLSDQKDERTIKKIQNKLEMKRDKLKSSVSKSRNSKRKADILKVLYDFELIKEKPTIVRTEQSDFLLDLTGADFRCANLAGLNLMRINLKGANLQGVNLERAYLFYTNLESPDRKNTTKLQGASLERAYLQSIDPDSDCITNLECADLRGADLKSANLGNVNLRGIKLNYARLEGANLENADFTGGGSAHCSFSNLSHATGLLKGQLEKAKLCRTILPANLNGISDRDCPNNSN